jgi:hypothetical protein
VSQRRSVSFVSNLRWGVAWGVAVAAVYSLYVTVLYLIEGSRPFDRLHTSLLMTIAAYAFGGVAAGAVVGVMRPYVRIRLVAILVGILGAVFVFFGAAVASEGMPWGWTRSTWLSIAGCALLLGSFAGNWLWTRPIGSRYE